jgi:hypothetical protein
MQACGSCQTRAQPTEPVEMAIVVEPPKTFIPKQGSSSSAAIRHMLYNPLTTVQGVVLAVCGISPLFGRCIMYIPVGQEQKTSMVQLQPILCFVSSMDLYRAATTNGADAATVFGNCVLLLLSFSVALKNGIALKVVLRQVALPIFIAAIGLVVYCLN